MRAIESSELDPTHPPFGGACASECVHVLVCVTHTAHGHLKGRDEKGCDKQGCDRRGTRGRDAKRDVVNDVTRMDVTRRDVCVCVCVFV